MKKMNIWLQNEILLPKVSRGFHIITSQINDFIEPVEMSIGILYIFIKHTSASITINEGADPSVRVDFETHFNKLVPEDSPDFIHNAEGPDDMPAHIKSALTNNQISLSVKKKELLLGTWQGIYLFEHRIESQVRKIIHHFIGD